MREGGARGSLRSYVTASPSPRRDDVSTVRRSGGRPSVTVVVGITGEQYSDEDDDDDDDNAGDEDDDDDGDYNGYEDGDDEYEDIDDEDNNDD